MDELLKLMGDTPDSMIGGYRSHLDAGYHGQPVDFHFDVGGSMANAFGDHGNETAIQILALAIVSGIADLAVEGLVHNGAPEDIGDSVDGMIDTEIETATQMVDHLIRTYFRSSLIETTLARLEVDDESPDGEPDIN